ncbi:hypothetical protein ACWC09_50815 [Streptomyces sp. NPDC001617]
MNVLAATPTGVPESSAHGDVLLPRERSAQARQRAVVAVLSPTSSWGAPSTTNPASIQSGVNEPPASGH